MEPLSAAAPDTVASAVSHPASRTPPHAILETMLKQKQQVCLVLYGL